MLQVFHIAQYASHIYSIGKQKHFIAMYIHTFEDYSSTIIISACILVIIYISPFYDCVCMISTCAFRWAFGVCIWEMYTLGKYVHFGMNSLLSIIVYLLYMFVNALIVSNLFFAFITFFIIV